MILRLKDKALPKGPMTSYEAKIMITVKKKIQEMVIIITGIRKNNKRSRKKYLV